MTAEILAIGTEIVMGQIANTDAQFLSRALNELGIGVLYHTAVGDNPTRIKEALGLAMSRVDMVVMTGGLGPTLDDITKEMAAEYLKLPMEIHPPTYEALCQFFQKRGMIMPENNARQAYFPKGAFILPNAHGTAPGCILTHDRQRIIILPGPPRELNPMFMEQVRPILLDESDDNITSRRLRIYGIGESDMENRLMHLISHQTNPTIAPYIMGYSDLMIRITARTPKGVDPTPMLEAMEQEICMVLGDAVFSHDDEDMATVVVNLLVEHGQTIAVAESCTGGMLTSMLVDVPGVSQVLLEGAVTYSNESKERTLDVEQDMLISKGAVSAETAQAMALGMLKRSGADIALATTGIAGPDGGTPDKPVGLVYVALAAKDTIQVKELRLHQNRNDNRRYTCVAAFNMVRMLYK